jgi:hypothetical protein
MQAKSDDTSDDKQMPGSDDASKKPRKGGKSDDDSEKPQKGGDDDSDKKQIRAKGKEEMMMNPTLMRRRAARVAKARRAERKVARSLRMMKNSRPTMTPPLMPSPLREESLMMTPTTSPLRVKRKEESLMMRTPMTRK